MPKHNKQARQLGALIRLYRRWGKLEQQHKDWWFADYGIPVQAYEEAEALEQRLPAEMLAWARLHL